MPMAQINGVNIHYHTAGDGVPIIFIHPPLLNSSTFNYQKAELAQYARVITFDIRGHGHSSSSQQPITYDLIAEDMKQLLDYLKVDRAYVCGYSAGGQVALHAMLKYPDRYAGGILLSAMPETSDWWLKTQLTVATTMMRTGLRGLLQVGISWGNKDSRQTYKQLISHAKHGDTQNITQYYAYSKRYSITDHLHRIKQPILLQYGQKDRSFYRYAEILHHRLPSSSLYFMRGVGHQLPTKAGSRVNRLIMLWLRMQVDAKLNADQASANETDWARRLEDLAMYGNGWNEQELIHTDRDL